MRTVPLNLTFFYFTIMIICKRASIWLANIWWTPMVGKKSNTNNSFINNPFGSHLVNESAGSVNKWTWIIGFDSFTNLNLKWLNYFIFSKHYYKMALDILEENEKSWKSSTFTILYDTSAFRHEASKLRILFIVIYLKIKDYIYSSKTLLMSIAENAHLTWLL